MTLRPVLLKNDVCEVRGDHLGGGRVFVRSLVYSLVYSEVCIVVV